MIAQLIMIRAVSLLSVTVSYHRLVLASKYRGKRKYHQHQLLTTLAYVNHVRNSQAPRMETKFNKKIIANLCLIALFRCQCLPRISTNI